MTRPKILRSHRDAPQSTLTIDSDSSRQLLRERMALFGQVAGLLAFGFWIAASVLEGLDSGDWAQAWRSPANQFHLAAAAIFALVWLVCRTTHPNARMMLAIDALGTALPGACFAGMVVAVPQPSGVFPALLAVTNTMLARAVIVPSRSLRTLLVSVAACLPVMAVGFTGDGVPGLPLEGAFGILWCAVACAIATVGSHVIYGLRAEVREARRLGQYTLEALLGQGGMGEVYLARHALLRRPTAIKLVKQGVAGSQEIERFQREVQNTSMMTHPNTVAIYDYGHTADGVFFYAMEYLEGPSLQMLVEARGPMPPARVIHVLRQACGSLAEAHGAGLIHRDIKPANLMLCVRGGHHDVLKVLDFGLVKSIDGSDVGLTASNTIAGTPLHLSPEAISTPDEVGPGSDIYALGTVAWYLLAGRHVFDGHNAIEVLGKHLHVPAPRLSAVIAHSVPPDLEDVVMQCLSKHAKLRPADVRSLDAMLAACEHAGQWTEALAAQWWEDEWPSIRDDRLARAAAEKAQAETPTRVVERRAVMVDDSA